MKVLIYLISAYCLIGCANGKAHLVEEIKTAKNERAQAKINQGNYSAAAKHLFLFNNAPTQQRQIYREAFENDKKRLTDSPEVLNDHKKLDSIALIWEARAMDAQNKIESLELELKKY